ncbi:MAG: hypothetical protein IPJ34_41720 [Myxococcales bacterium]|nr:hypothetical protein [Myxococcales bacterium]
MARAWLAMALLVGACREPPSAAVADPAAKASSAPSPSSAVGPSKSSHAATCAAIAREIAALAVDHPQLAGFHADSATLEPDCRIVHTYHCHPAKHVGGWAAGVPEPDADGLWLHLGIFDPAGPAATSQLYTQPAMLPDRTLDGRRVVLFVHEGSATKPLQLEILKILRRYGLKEP